MKKFTIRYNKPSNLYEVFIDKEYTASFSSKSQASSCINTYKTSINYVNREIKKFQAIKTIYDILDYKN